MERALEILKLPAFKYNEYNMNNLRVKPIDVLKIASGFAATFFVYKTIKIYMIRKKYKHIPGPKTNG